MKVKSLFIPNPPTAEKNVNEFMQIQFELKLNQFINDSISMFHISIIDDMLRALTFKVFKII